MVNTAATERAEGVTTGGGASLPALRITAVLAVLNLACQFVTAGQLLPRGGPVELHATGAIVLHVLTGLVTVAAAWRWYVTRGPVWPTVLAAVVFVLTFVQAYEGSYTTLAIHVPGALVLTVGTVWLATWSFTAARPTRV